MTTYTCVCGAQIKLPHGSTGKRARCRNCGAIFTVPPDPDEEWVSSEGGDDPQERAYHVAGEDSLQADAAARQAGENVDRAALSGYRPDELLDMGRTAAATRRRRGFWADVGWTFVLFINPGNLFMLLLIWIMHSILPFLTAAGCIGLVGLIIVQGWLCSYWFNVVSDAAAGEEDLPGLALTEGFLDDVAFPLLKFIGATALAWAPAIIVAVLLALAGSMSIGAVLAGPTPSLLAACGVSMLLWPMVLLVTAIGSLFAVVRVDLLVRTVVRTLLPYLAVCSLVGGAGLLRTQAPALVGRVSAGGGGFFMPMVLTAFLQAYFGIVSMRIVGLYYHHFKERFAWSWG